MNNNIFLHIGAQKTATTTIYEILKQHQGINLANKKETKFFYNDELYALGLKSYYKQFFNPDHKGPLLDIDPDYMCFDFVAERIYRTLGSDVKFIVNLRQPANRAYSNYLMECFRNKETLSFDEAIKSESTRSTTLNGRYTYGYIDKGLYAKHINSYLKYYDVKNFKFYLFDKDFKERKERTLKDMCNFMNVSWSSLLNIDLKENSKRKIRSKLIDKLTRQNKYYNFLSSKLLPNTQRKQFNRMILGFNSFIPKGESLSDEDRRKLTQTYFKSDIIKLEKIINRDLSHWLA